MANKSKLKKTELHLTWELARRLLSIIREEAILKAVSELQSQSTHRTWKSGKRILD
jgi:hypothetical protein